MKHTTIGMVTRVFLLAACAVCSAQEAKTKTEETNAAPAAVRYDFKPTAFPSLIEAGKQGDENYQRNAIFAEENDVYAGKPVLRLESKNTRSGAVIFNVYLPDDRLPEFRGKRVKFRWQVKWLQGSGALDVTLRCGGRKADGGTELIARTVAVFQGERGKWVPFELTGMLPDRADLTGVNFHTRLVTTDIDNPPVVLLDECVLELADAENAPRIEPLLSALLAEKPEGPLTLVKDGKALAVIVTEEKPTPTVQFAVQELNEHLKLCLGVELPVVKDGTATNGPAIHIGKTSLTQRLGLSPAFFAPDRWTVLRVRDTLILSGGDTTNAAVRPEREAWVYGPFGSLYATYEFLERALGVRWYWPGSLGTVAPKRETLEVGAVNWSGAPSYDARLTWGIRPIMSKANPYYTNAEGWRWLRRLRWGSGDGNDPIGMHSFTHWNEKYAAEHPNWFALQPNGKRLDATAEGTYKGHLCFSNPEVLAAAVAEKREQFDKGARSASVMTGDGSTWCQCADCQKLRRPDLGPSGEYSYLMWGFVNKVAAETYKTHPQCLIKCCAYADYVDAPKDMPFMPNVSVTICVDGLSNGSYDPDGKGKYLKRLNDWSAKTGNKIFLWNYWFHEHMWYENRGRPSFFPHAIKEWFQMESGRVSGRIHEAGSFCFQDPEVQGGWMFDSLTCYVAFRLMWNRNDDVDRLLEEFYGQFYGPAAGPLIKRFYEALEKAFVDPNTKRATGWEKWWVDTYPPEFVKREMALLREAVKVTRGAEPYHARAEETLKGFLPFEAASARMTAAGKKIANERVDVPKIESAPAIDGNLDDACWKKAAVASDFVDMFNGRNLRAETEVRVVRDAETLYFGIRGGLPEGVAKTIQPPGALDGPLWDFESAEIFLAQGVKKYQFLIGPDDGFTDFYRPDYNQQFTGEAIKWNYANARYKTARKDKEWTAEIAIPLRSLELTPPTKETPWKANFCRNYYYPLDPNAAQKTWLMENYSWRPAFGNFQNVERFGAMYFE
ncbi:MAG: DUF4838 domain-containing protein [Kiritimatiellae bacterium]|nr:DUF4838 domain-containing protein [Kiritimatiellia bacterium]